MPSGFPPPPRRLGLLVWRVAATVAVALISLNVGVGPAPAQAQTPPPGPPGGPPPGFGPGTFLAPRVLEVADLDKDGRLTVAEGAQAAEALVNEADTEKRGSTDAAGLGRALNRRLAPPGQPGDEGPGSFMAVGLVAAADGDKDGRVSPAEAASFATRTLRDLDPRATSFDEAALAGAINRRLMPAGGPGGMNAPDRKVLKDHDADGDGILNQAERGKARDFLRADRAKDAGRGGPGGFGPPGFGPGRPGGPGGGPGRGFGGDRDEPTRPGPHVEPSAVATYPGRPLYDPAIVRTLFLDFEEADWEAALDDFHGTDVDLAATLRVDGRTLPGVGVRFRGMSSYGMVRPGHKRSLNLALDATNPRQTLDGFKTLNLLNAHEDASLLHTVLYLQIARTYIPAPQANFVRVVINGESWGLYTNAQQFDKILIAQDFRKSEGKGARWKVNGNPGADGGLSYVGDDIAEYRRRYEIKSGDSDKDWRALIKLCQTLNQTPPDRLEAALRPMLDIDGVLWFLALDNALINGDGYWTRASDYSIYRDPAGVFHLLPHDANETFGPAMMFGPPRPGGGRGGPGGPGGPRGGGLMGGFGPRPGNLELDPLIGLDDARTPLRGKLLAVPALRARYLDHVRTIARDWLDWARLGPIVAQYRDLIGPEVRADTRKLTSTSAFEAMLADAAPNPEAGAGADAPRPGGPASVSLRAFADRRRRYLLDYPAIRDLAP